MTELDTRPYDLPWDDEPPAYESANLDRTPPNDISAEMSVLSACMFSREACRAVLAALDPSDMYRPAHGTILAAVGKMHAASLPVDPITLIKFLADNGEIGRAGGPGYVQGLVQAAPTAANVEYHAEIIQDRALRRALIELGTRLVQMGYSPDGDTFDLVEHAVAMSRDIRDRGRASEDLPVQDILDFVQHEDTYDWLVEGLLERRDRLILTAAEGGGKSVLMRQLAVTLAAGIHPFKTFKPIDPVRVLMLDCENGEPASRRAFRPLLESAARIERPITRDQFLIECRPRGLDLTKPNDRSWAMRRIESLMPDVLIIGPVYRLHAGNPNDEELARKVSVVIDEARDTAGCAVLMEAHSPHGNGLGPRPVRPVGSTLWMRWPEFGFGLRPVEDEKSAASNEGCRGRAVVPWRGMRDERDWPAFIKQGEHWPWTSYTPVDADPYTGHSQTGAIW